MIQNQSRKWLLHLKDSIPQGAYGYSISMYSIALEGWRRGLKLKFINENRRKSEVYYSLTYKDREHRFSVSRGDKVTNEALKICRNKHQTKEYLLRKKVPTPQGKLFKKENSDKDVIDYAEELGYPLVIKPVAGTGGTGVIANIKNKDEFIEALSYVRNDLNNTEVIVERHFDGRGYRIYVIGDQVVGAFDRIPANVIGDGENDIKTLLKLKLKERDKNPALFRRPIKIDREMKNLLREKDYTISSVPKQGERVILKTTNNVSSGGDSIDVTDQLTDEIKNIAINAVKAIPGLEHAGLDMIIDTEQNTGVILEINSMPSIRNHLFPNEGIARDIPKALIDYYFPETKSESYKGKPLFYFDFQTVFDVFQQGKAKEIIIPDAPQGDIVAKTFIITSSIKGVDYAKSLRKKARKLKVNGYVKFIKHDKISLVLSGSSQSVNQIVEEIKGHSFKRDGILEVVEKKRNTPVQIGFDIINMPKARNLTDGYYPVRLRSGNGSTKPKRKSNVNKSKDNLREERDYYKQEFMKIKNSNSWKATKPFRKVGKLFK